jgi:type VI secretion system protein ImpA
LSELDREALPTAAGIDLSVLIPLVSVERPAGAPFDREIGLLEQRAAPPSSLVAGKEGAAIPDHRNWTIIRTEAFEFLASSRHLKLAVLLTQALIRTDGWSGFEVGLAAIRLLIQHHWPHLYPAVAEDGDPYPRINLIAELASDEMLTELRKASVLGPLRLRELLDGKTKPAEVESRYLAAKPSEQRAPGRSVAELRAIGALTSQQNAAFDLEPTIALAEQAAVRLSALALKLGGKDTMAVQPTPAADHNGPSAAPERTGTVLGGIRSPSDVVLAIEQICEYYETHDRSSPVPLLLTRAKGLVNRTFLEAVRDLADKGIPQVELLVGPTERSK